MTESVMKVRSKPLDSRRNRSRSSTWISIFAATLIAAAANLPADKRVGPAQKSYMATIAARGGGKPAVSAANGANHYRFVGIEFTASTSDYNYGLVTLGAGERDAARLPHDIEIDRSYF